MLFPNTHDCNYFINLDPSSTSISVPAWTCNEVEFTQFDLSSYSLLETLEIGDDCFSRVNTFKIQGINNLRTLKIGKNSFTIQKSCSWSIILSDEDLERGDPSKSFHIVNCDSLESIEIGQYSFSDYRGDFELAGLPSLQTITVGSTTSVSYNFYGSSFVINGFLLCS